MKKMKVFCGYGFLKDVVGQVKIMVATTSQKKASEIIGVSPKTIKDYFSPTSNKEDVELAMKKPETIFYIKRNSKGWIEYAKIEKLI